MSRVYTDDGWHGSLPLDNDLHATVYTCNLPLACIMHTESKGCNVNQFEEQRQQQRQQSERAVAQTSGCTANKFGALKQQPASRQEAVKMHAKRQHARSLAQQPCCDSQVCSRIERQIHKERGRHHMYCKWKILKSEPTCTQLND